MYWDYSQAILGVNVIEDIKIPTIILEWNEWTLWNDLEKKYSQGIKVADMPGVYEVKYEESEELLYIGQGKNLRHRIKQGLIRGKTQHDAGYKIRNNENTSKISVRWAETDRPAGVEEHLLKVYEKSFGKLPIYNKN